jgi:hypothetical protein
LAASEGNSSGRSARPPICVAWNSSLEISTTPFPLDEIVIKEIASKNQELRAIALGQDWLRLINHQRANREI